MKKTFKRYVVAPAVIGADGTLQWMFPPRRHNDIINLLRPQRPMKQGFVDNFGQYLTREEAFTIAESMGQIKKVHKEGMLFTEDMY